MLKIDSKVVVLLSTYNGQQYIEEQLISIVEQNYDGEIVIYIRDDGSKDNTGEVVKSFSKIYETENRKIIFTQCNNVGAQKSFLQLIQMAPEADYYFFADQDDVWKKNKVSRAVEMLEECEDDNCVYCSDYSIVDGKLNLVYEKQVELNDKTFNPLRLLFFNTFPGCVMAFNNKVMKIVREMNLSNCMMHDSMVLTVGAAIGTICYDSEPTILHRIHGDNVVGYGHKKIKPLKWIKEKFGLLFKKENYDVSELGARLLEVDGMGIKEKYKDDIIILRDFKSSFGKTMKLFKHSDLKRKIDRETLSIKCKILFHIF